MATFVTASFFRRVAAGAVDIALVGAVFVVGAAARLLVSGQTGITAYAVGSYAALALFVLDGIVLPARTGATAGGRLFRIRIVSVDRPAGKGIGFLAASARLFSAIGVSPLFLLGFAWYFVNRESRMWHDILAGTAVVPAGERPPAPFAEPSALRSIVGLVLGAFGTSAVTLVGAVVLAFFLFPPAALTVRPASLPADFPESIVIPAPEDIAGIAVTPHPERGSKTVRVTWGNLPADPKSIIYAYSTGLSLLGYVTTPELEANEPRLRFVEPTKATVGTIVVTPAADGKTVASVVLEVEYASAGAGE